ncbi:uncharacterized protein N7477_006511 [Penicillium maclennaniae]|uniref:uncharacterized protein n=1 Tax=Penicillium maclennaniae TaxID=1343394 RepID=UPI00254041A6|nr:uncharacterized protein N7477_006511 [Penicillium maclennaniae]KAJ5667941.1 hypothetical protein N7477_006511 [Penicillium maclennaniae]
MATSIVAAKRPFLTLPFLLPSWTDSLALGSRRYQSSYRRTKQRLRVKPDASFGPSHAGQDQIIYNPPSSAPTAYHTPNKFLPADDARRSMRVEGLNSVTSNCSPIFIAMVCEASPEKKQMQKQVLEAVQSRWGVKRRMAREDRQLRREAWARDE